MSERRLTFHVTNDKPVFKGYGSIVALKELFVRGARVDPTTVRVGSTLQHVTIAERRDGFECWKFDGPYKSWEPGGTISFEGLVRSARQVHITLRHEPRDLSWVIPVAGGKE